MEFIFTTAAGQTLFTRSDIMQGHHVHQQMNLTATFPYKPDKVIQRGQRIVFRNSEDALNVYEIRVVQNNEQAGLQQITAEHIAISELQDEHLNKKEITDKTAAQALGTILTGTLWSVGNNTASGNQSADISRGSVWQGVSVIQQNWNVYITPRVVMSSAGVITGRYLDISPAGAVNFHGLRLAVRKNLSDPCVIYNDEDVLTALYGYGANVGKAQISGDDTIEELTFADEVWTATSDHPAKPAGQIYLEWPEKTALYGRNGRPRYGYYQNGSIDSASVLLQKTWEALKQTAEPKINISGTVADLYRLGYKDQPIHLHDTCIVEIEETGEQFYKQIICFDEDLVNPANNRPEIGDYIPNIIYINRDTANKAGGGGGGGGRGQTNEEDDAWHTYTDWLKTDQMIGMVVGMRNGSTYIKGGEITLAINDDGGTTAKLSANVIDIDGIVSALLSYQITVQDLSADGISCQDITVQDAVNCDNIVADGTGFFGSLNVDEHNATWQTATLHSVSVSNAHNFLYGDANFTPTGRANGHIVLSHSTSTIHYLGY